jgi:MFS family permease
MREAGEVRRIHPARVLVPLGLGTALSLVGDATLYTVLPTHTVDAGISLAGVGVILGVNRAIRLLLNGPAGLAYDRLPRRRLFVPALFVGALSTALYALAPGFWPLLVARLLWGLAWSGIWVGGATMMVDVTTGQDRGRWTGAYQMWYFAGGALGALGGGALTDLVGYAMTMWIGASLTALGGLVALLTLPETRKARTLVPQNGREDAAPRDPPAASPGPAPTKAAPRRSGRGGALWLAATLQGVNRFVTSGVLSATLGLLVQERLERGDVALGVATVTGVLMAGRTMLGIAAAPAAGALSDRLGHRWAVVGLGLAAGALGAALMAWGLPAAVLAGVSAVAISRGVVQSLTATLTGDLAGPGKQGRAIGLLHTSGDLGSAVGPLVAYALLPSIGLRGVYLLCAALFGIGLVLTALVPAQGPQLPELLRRRE